MRPVTALACLLSFPWGKPDKDVANCLPRRCLDLGIGGQPQAASASYYGVRKCNAGCNGFMSELGVESSSREDAKSPARSATHKSPRSNNGLSWCRARGEEQRHSRYPERDVRSTTNLD